MGIISVIIGVLLAIFGISVIFTPMTNFLALGTLVAIVLLVWGIVTLVRAVSIKKYDLIFGLSIIAIILGFLLLLSPATTFATDMLILYLVAVFAVVRGIIAIVMGARTVKINKGKAVAEIIIGILAIIIGIICFANPLFEAAVIGYLVAIFFIYAGFDMICVGAFIGRGGDAV